MSEATTYEAKLYAAILCYLADGVIVTDETGTICFINEYAGDLFGYLACELVGKNVSVLLNHSFIDNDLDTGNGKIVSAGLQQVSAQHKDGSNVSVNLAISEAHVDSKRVFIGTVRNIDRRIETTSRALKHDNQCDSLTGLVNRSCFMEQMKKRVEQADKTEASFSVIILSIDRFKVINDNLGHIWGDMLLMAVAHRLTKAVDSDYVVARLGGDEFSILHVIKDRYMELEECVRCLQEELQAPYDLPGQEVKINVSIGVSLFPSNGRNADDLLRNATTALLKAKQDGSGQCVYYRPDLNTKSQHKLSLEAELHHALKRDQFRLHYQPQIDVLTGQICGVEALLRWQRNEESLVFPGEFIDLLEQTGLVVPVGEWVLNEACRVNQSWQSAGLPEIRVSVNLSVRQLQLQNITQLIASVLASSGLGAKYLDLEITESMLLQDIYGSSKTLATLRDMGVSLSIDDFGTGYSSLSYLQCLPINTIKIDRSFINDVTTDPGSMAIVRSIIAMSHNMRLNVVAEGVETIEQATFLSKNDCDVIQGYYYSKPVSAENFRRLLSEGACYDAIDTGAAITRSTLLIVDDEDGVRSSLKRVFRREGYHIITASSAEEAFGLLAENDVGVILSDQRMPCMTGSQFLTRVRNMYPDTVRIILSGYADLDVVLESVNEGSIYKFLVKPWDDDLLKGNIREAFKYHDLMQKTV